MSAQHKVPGRSGKRARRERALAFIQKELEKLEGIRGRVGTDYFQLQYSTEFQRLHREAANIKAELARPLRPIPPHQARKLTR